jgi:hypothetical protein
LKAYWPNLLAVVSALNKLEALRFQGLVTRGIKPPIQSFLAQIKDGTLFVERSFMSTSVSQKTSTSFAGHPSLGGIFMEVSSLTGVDVSSLAFFEKSDEREVLFKPGTLFKTVSVKTGGKMPIMKLEELEATAKNLSKAVVLLSPQGTLDPLKKPFPADYPILASILEQESQQ